MIECVFTLDYEIYGDGTGALKELVYQPTISLRRLFLAHGARFVTFVEAAELQKIEEQRTDPAIGLVKRQLRELAADGFEIGLHLHPQWCKARYTDGRWVLEPGEYNLCRLSAERVADVVDEAMLYLRRLLDAPGFTPLSFRAGNWLFQPSQPAAGILADRGVRIDSSLFKGGLLHAHGLDYRPSLANGPWWSFSTDVNVADPRGVLLEMPIFVRMVPFWRMVTGKRLAFRSPVAKTGGTGPRRAQRVRDLLRPRYPLKLDFCRMTLKEMTDTVDRVRRRHGQAEHVYPVVAIGHTKDLVDLGAVDGFLSYLDANRIPISTFARIHPRLQRPAAN